MIILNMDYLLVLIGIALLVKGADLLIEGSVSLANRLKIPSLIIGLTVVAIGTSLPEFMINIFSTFKGSTGLAFGNIMGSNIANTLLVLGVAALISPLKIAHATVWKEIPFSLLAALVLLFAANGVSVSATTQFLTRKDGLMLLAFLALFIYYLYKASQQKRSELVDEVILSKKHRTITTAAYISIGILGLCVGGTFAVNGAIALARGLGLSEFLIAATVVALGTSLPELVTSVRASQQGDSDLAVGNVIGSNILNIFLILGVTATLSQIRLPANSIIDFLFLIGSSFLLFVFMFIGGKHTLSRVQGSIFIISYLFYVSIIALRG